MLPAADGARLTVNAALAEAARVNGVVSPETPTPAPLTLTALMVTLEPPVLLSVTLFELVWPTLTLPKATLEGLAESLAAVTAAPDNVTLCGLPVALSATERVPL